MRIVLALIAVLYSAAAFAQDKPPPTVGGKPLVQVKPKGSSSAPEKPAKRHPVAVRLQPCLDIDDQTKERLNCYDAVVPPKPNPKAPAAKGVLDCKFTKAEDERLNSYKGFVESMPKLPKS